MQCSENDIYIIQKAGCRYQPNMRTVEFYLACHSANSSVVITLSGPKVVELIQILDRDGCLREPYEGVDIPTILDHAAIRVGFENHYAVEIASPVNPDNNMLVFENDE